jgi:hypothetical protein
MRFLNREGFTHWMFDGLDEFFAGESDFIATLEAALAPGSHARILVCARDSLLTSSSALDGLVARQAVGGAVRLYELTRWGRAEQRALAWVRYAGRLPPEQPAVDPLPVRTFLNFLDSEKAAAELATLPYYAELLMDLVPKGRPPPSDEMELLSAAVDALIDREAEKLKTGDLGFGWDVFSGAEGFMNAAELVEAWGSQAFAVAGERALIQAALETLGRARLVELIEALAHRIRMLVPYPGEADGLPIAEIEQMAGLYLDVGLYPDLQPRVLLAVVQFAFFGPGDGKGQVRFAHEIIADYLAARHALAMIAARPDSADALGQALGVRADLDRSIVLRYLVREISRQPELRDAVLGHIDGGRLRPQHDAAGRLLARHLEGAAR